MEIDDMNAKLEQQCEEPICDSSDVYNSATCTCSKKLVETTTCSPGFIPVYTGGECSCAVAINLQCPAGSKLNRNCQCTSESDGSIVKEECPLSSYRPSSSACYCLFLGEPSCGLPNGVYTDDKCDCEVTADYTPKCSNSDVCQLIPDGCSCTSAS